MHKYSHKTKTNNSNKCKYANCKKHIVTLLLLLLAIMLISNPARYMQSVTNGLILYFKYVLPCMLPFFFITAMLTALGGIPPISYLLQPMTKKLYNLPHEAGFILPMSMLCGSPVGSKMLEDYYNSGLISTNNSRTLTALSTTVSPLFIVATVGVKYLKSVKFGFLLLIVNILACLLNGLLYSNKNTEMHICQIESKDRKGENIIKDSVYSSCISLMMVAFFVSLFYFISDVMIDLKIISVLSVPLKGLFSICGLSVELAEPVIISLIELTRGLSELSSVNCDIKLLLPIMSMLIATTGGSIAMQCFTYLKECKISLGYFLLTRISEAFISYILMSLILWFF